MNLIPDLSIPHKLDSILFVGTGGGNDIYSTIFAIESLKRAGWSWKKCDITGVLSPFHTYGSRTVFESHLGIREIDEYSIRQVKTKKSSWEISFIDTQVAKLVNENFGTLRIRRVYGLPLNNGSIGITAALKHFHALGYDMIILVDIGGDILYRGEEDTHVLSPMFDAMVLKGFTDAEIPGFLFEAGPGTDGELEPESIYDAFIDTTPKGFDIHPEAVNAFEIYYKKYIEPVRPGRTVPYTIKSFRSNKGIVSLEYKPRTHIGDSRWYGSFTQRIDTDLCKKYYLIDPFKIKNPFAVRCTSPLDWFIQAQSLIRTNCEPNIEFYNDRGTWVQFVTPSKLLGESDKNLVLNEFAQQILLGHSDYGIMFTEDRPFLQIASKFTISDIEGTNKLVRITPK